MGFCSIRERSRSTPNNGKMEIYSRRAGQVSVDGILRGNIRDKGGWILAKLTGQDYCCRQIRQ